MTLQYMIMVACKCLGFLKADKHACFLWAWLTSAQRLQN